MSNISGGSYSDADAVAATDGVIDADTVDGQEAADLGAPASTQSASVSGGYDQAASFSASGGAQSFSTDEDAVYCDGVRVRWPSGDEMTRVTIWDAEGSVILDTGFISDTSGTWTTNLNAQFLEEVRVDVNGNGSYYIDLHTVGVASHTHNI